VSNALLFMTLSTNVVLALLFVLTLLVLVCRVLPIGRRDVADDARQESIMIRIVNGKRYNTETAELLCNISRGGYSRSDFAYDDTDLYVTKNGNFFIAGEGGARSRWSQTVGQNQWTGGSGLRPIDKADARTLLEQYGSVEQIEIHFPVEDA
jgi:hypothetical protein